MTDFCGLQHINFTQFSCFFIVYELRYNFDTLIKLLGFYADKFTISEHGLSSYIFLIIRLTMPIFTFKQAHNRHCHTSELAVLGISIYSAGIDGLHCGVQRMDVPLLLIERVPVDKKGS